MGVHRCSHSLRDTGSCWSDPTPCATPKIGRHESYVRNMFGFQLIGSSVVESATGPLRDSEVTGYIGKCRVLPLDYDMYEYCLDLSCLIPHGHTPSWTSTFSSHGMPPAWWHHKQITGLENCLHTMRPYMLLKEREFCCNTAGRFAGTQDRYRRGVLHVLRDIALVGLFGRSFAMAHHVRTARGWRNPDPFLT